ncbi:hypothetical protein, partial [Reyranella sp.]|uniref:hypothetical protein n=1 Tax=Reyranella sp. TaxID=1929291 RepID=UPI003F6ED02B
AASGSATMAAAARRAFFIRYLLTYTSPPARRQDKKFVVITRGMYLSRPCPHQKLRHIPLIVAPTVAPQPHFVMIEASN